MVTRQQEPLLAVAVAIAAVATMFPTTASGASYAVGAPGGSWDLRTNLTAWASSVNFRRGDQLVFTYDASAHDVAEVSQDGYLSCSAQRPVSAVLMTGSDTIKLDSAGKRYFICAVPGHCAAGMKPRFILPLEVRVTDDTGCNRTPLLPAPPGSDSTICTFNKAPGVKPAGSGVAPGSSGSLSSVLVTMVSLLLVGLVIV